LRINIKINGTINIRHFARIGKTCFFVFVNNKVPAVSEPPLLCWWGWRSSNSDHRQYRNHSRTQMAFLFSYANKYILAQESPLLLF